VKTDLTLVGYEIEGTWNVPLLKNAAEISAASLTLVKAAEIDDVLNSFDHVLACEAVRRSRSAYECAAPRGRSAILVGNERLGIPAEVLKKAEHVVAVPMLGRGISSINVAAAAAVVLYAVERDFGRKRFRLSSLFHADVDVLILGPPDPSEIGSLLRSAWAFGWQRVFLADPNGAWFTKDRPTVLAGRAAARCEVNRIAVCPETRVNLQDYDSVVVCNREREGTPLSRFTLPNRGRTLLVFGNGDCPPPIGETAERVFVDYAASGVEPAFRHAGSIFLSVVSQQLRRGRRG
jgi:tRNA G18 (ribose-2'-O)-methylase SpoU